MTQTMQQATDKILLEQCKVRSAMFRTFIQKMSEHNVLQLPLLTQVANDLDWLCSALQHYVDVIPDPQTNDDPEG